MPESKSKRKPKRRTSRRAPAQQAPRRRRTARWVPYAFFGLMGVGVIVIIGNYMNLFGSFKTWLLFAGLGLMGAGFAVSTRWY